MKQLGGGKGHGNPAGGCERFVFADCCEGDGEAAVIDQKPGYAVREDMGRIVA